MDEYFKDADNRLSQAENILKNLVRVGKVVGRDEAKCRCRVQFDDNDQIVSYWCQVLTPLTHKKKTYGLPAEDEMVVCVFLPLGHDHGFILGSVYNQQDAIPTGANKDKVIFEDEGGNRYTADGASGEQTIDTNKLTVNGDTEINGKETVNGDVMIVGNLRVIGTITDIRGDLTNHLNGQLPRTV